MPRSFYEMYIHLIWSTKARENLITSEIEKDIIEIIKTKCIKYNCTPIAIGNTTNHIHLLLSISPKTNIELFVKEAKGSTSYFVNHHKDCALYWQDGYGAISVSKSGMKYVVDYILHQKEHHSDIFKLVNILEKNSQ